MKNIFGLLLIAAAFTSCGKTETYSEDFSAATVINASASATAASNFYVVVDGINQTSSAIAFRGNTGYLNLRPGTRNIAIQSGAVLAPPTFATLASESFTANTSSTFVVYDTLLSPTGTLKVLRLADTLTPAASGFLKFRFLPLAPNAPQVDVTYLRTSVTPNDSVTVTGLTFPGPTPSAAVVSKLSTFVTIPAGAYTIKQKLAGTQTIYNSVTYSPSVGGIFKGIYTFYTTGTAQSQVFSIAVQRNYP